MANIITKDFIQYVPPPMSTNFKVEINGVDVSDDVIDVEYTMAVTTEIGDCRIVLDDNADTYTGLYSGGESISIYLDFTDGDTKRFEGYVEKQEKELGDEGKKLRITGRHVATTLMDLTVTEDYTSATPVSTILISLIADYATGFTSTNVNTSTSTHTPKWGNKPFWDCIIELCRIANFDCYVDNDKDFHFFERGTVLNTIEAVTDQNCIGIEGLGTDTTDVKNVVIVYGEDNAGNQIIYKAEDSQSSYNTKEKVIEDTKIKTYDQAKEIGDAELSLLKSPDTVGKSVSFLLPELNPGDKLWISYPDLELHGTHRIAKFTTNIFEQTTTVYLEKVSNLPKVLRDRVSKESSLETIKNPGKMEHSLNLSFDDSSVIKTFNDTEITDNKLRLQSGKTTGTAVSNTRTANSDISKCYVTHKGSAVSGNVKYYANVSGSGQYEELTIGTVHNFAAPGKLLTVKIEINGTATELEGVCLQYK